MRQNKTTKEIFRYYFCFSPVSRKKKYDNGWENAGKWLKKKSKGGNKSVSPKKQR